MSATNKNINEQFLIALLDTTDSVYFDNSSSATSPEYFYFYPKGLGFTIEIPLFDSEHVNIKFVEDTHSGNKKIFNFSIASPHEIERFMTQLYSKHADMLNGSVANPEYTNLAGKLESLLRLPVEDLNGNYENETKNLKLDIQHNDSESFKLLLGDALYNYNGPRVLKPLSPIVITCFHQNRKTNAQNVFKIVIPTYRIKEFPTLSELAHSTLTTTDIDFLSESIGKVNPRTGAILQSIILDLKLDNHEEKPNRKNKI